MNQLAFFAILSLLLILSDKAISLEFESYLSVKHCMAGVGLAEPVDVSRFFYSWSENNQAYVLGNKTLKRLNLDEINQRSFDEVFALCGAKLGEDYYFKLETSILDGTDEVITPVYLRATRKPGNSAKPGSFSFDAHVNEGIDSPITAQFGSACKVPSAETWGPSLPENDSIEREVVARLAEMGDGVSTFDSIMLPDIAKQVARREGETVRMVTDRADSLFSGAVSDVLENCKATGSEAIARAVDSFLKKMQQAGRAGAYRDGTGIRSNIPYRIQNSYGQSELQAK